MKFIIILIACLPICIVQAQVLPQSSGTNWTDVELKEMQKMGETIKALNIEAPTDFYLSKGKEISNRHGVAKFEVQPLNPEMMCQLEHFVQKENTIYYEAWYLEKKSTDYSLDAILKMKGSKKDYTDIYLELEKTNDPSIIFKLVLYINLKKSATYIKYATKDGIDLSELQIGTNLN